MPNKFNIPITLTEAQNKSGYSFVIFTANSTQSTYRNIPYFEMYHGRNGVMETPTEYLRKAAEDEKARKKLIVKHSHH